MVASQVVFMRTPLSLDGLLLTMHSTNPCNARDVHKGLRKGPWFAKTIAMMMSIDPPMFSALMSLVNRLQVCDNPNVRSPSENSLMSNTKANLEDQQDTKTSSSVS